MSSSERWLGLDVGGANLKVATSDGYARLVEFALWRHPDQLAAQLAELLRQAPPHAGVVATMTGELCDCFSSKVDGVAAIVDAVEQAAVGVKTRFYGMGLPTGETLSSAEARDDWRRVAAANWHALAAVLSRKFEAGGMLIDVGSTTTDVVPYPYNEASVVDDTDRLLSSQLLYQGVRRTPICAIVDELPYRGQMCAVAAELFATTTDVLLTLDYLPESESTDSADGRASTKANARARLARMVCADTSRFGGDDAIAVAEFVAGQMIEKLAGAIHRVSMQAHRQLPRDSPRMVIAGSGAWLARRALARLDCEENVEPLADLISKEASICAPAWAVAYLMDQGS